MRNKKNGCKVLSLGCLCKTKNTLYNTHLWARDTVFYRGNESISADFSASEISSGGAIVCRQDRK